MNQMPQSINMSASYFNNTGNEDRATARSAEAKYRAGCWAFFHSLFGRQMFWVAESVKTPAIVSLQTKKVHHKE